MFHGVCGYEPVHVLDYREFSMKSDCHKEIRYSLLKEYMEGEPSEEKKELIASWFEEKEQTFKLEKCLKELWNETDPGKVTPPGGHARILDRIHHKINMRHSGTTPTEGSTKKKADINMVSILKNLSRVAAIIMLPVLIYVGWEMLNRRVWQKNQSEIVYNEIICPLGARSQFELPDGTTGWLNNGSSLRYPARFNGDTRHVELTGEAYFDVTHHRNRPFIIDTDRMDVKVLGTRLNVYAYPDDHFQSFTLEEGTIELIRLEDGEEITIMKMKPGQHAVYSATDEQLDMLSVSPDTRTIVLDHEGDGGISGNKTTESQNIEAPKGKINIGYGETSQYTDWKDGKLVLRNDPMPIMLKRIERWYRIKFIVRDDRINKYRYWATFQEENLDQVLKMLSLTGPIRFQKRPVEQMADGTYKTQVIEVVFKE